MIMINMLFDFLIGLLAGRAVANTARTARNTAALVELAAMTEAQKVAFQKRQAFLAGQRRFVFIVFGAIVAVAWTASALTGGS